MPGYTWRKRAIGLATATACLAPLLTAGGAVAATATDGTTVTNDAVTTGPGSYFSYSSGWRTSAGTSKYLNDDHYSPLKGSSYTFRFSGTSVKLFGAKAPHHGKASVQIDGGTAVIVDTYAYSRQEGALLFSSAQLTPGTHIVKVTVLGTKRSTATGTTVAVDRAVASNEVVTTRNDAATTGTAGVFAYSGGWQTSTGKAGKYWGDDHYSSTKGSSYTFRFSGTSVRLFGAKAPHHGKASVQIDGGSAVTVDTYASSRQENVLLFASPTLAAGAHTVKVTVTGTKRSVATGTTIAVDRAVSTAPVLPAPEPTPVVTSPAPEPTPVVTSPAPEPTPVTTSPAPEPTPVVTSPSPEPTPVVTSPSPEPTPVATTSPIATAPTVPRNVVLHESGDGAELFPYASTTLNSTHPLWHVESGSDPVDRVGGVIRKVDPQQFHRMFSTKRFGGPGKSLKISYRARATAIRDRAGSSIVEGAKFGLKFAQDPSITGYSKDDPRSVMGGTPQQPGSYMFLTGLTEGGYMELSRNGYGSDGYKFFSNKRVGYEPGTWKDITITVEWLSASSMRVRYWHNADGTGTPVYEATDTDSPFAGDPGYLWLRTDDADWEYDHITVEQT